MLAMKKPTRDDFDEALECLGIEAERLRRLSAKRKKLGDSEFAEIHKQRAASVRRVLKWMEQA